MPSLTCGWASTQLIDAVCNREPRLHARIVARLGKRGHPLLDEAIHVGTMVVNHLLRAGPEFAVGNHGTTTSGGTPGAQRSSR